MAVTTFAESGTDATQDLTFYSTAVGAVTSATDQAHTGPRSLKFFTSSPAATATLITRAGILDDTGSQVSVWFRFDAAPTAQRVFFSLRNASDQPVCLVEMRTDRTLSLSPSGATAAVGSTVLSVDTWYRLSVSYYITNTTTFQFRLYVNGVLEATANAGTLARTGTSLVGLSIVSNVGANKTHWFDDLVVLTGGASSGSQPDPGTTSANSLRVTNKRPLSNGTTNGFTTQIGAGGSGYGSGHAAQVNEQPLSTTNGWSMVGAGAAVTEEFTIEGSTVGDQSLAGYGIVDYVGWLYAKSSGSQTAQIKVGGATSNISLTTTNTMFLKAAASTTFPAGGTDIGIVTATDLQTVSLYEAGALFVIEPSAGNRRRRVLLGAA
jgi:hypothetical protein